MEIFFFIMKELDELVKCKACQEKENMIQTLDNKIRHMEKKNLQRTMKSGLMCSRHLGKKLRKIDAVSKKYITLLRSVQYIHAI